MRTVRHMCLCDCSRCAACWRPTCGTEREQKLLNKVRNVLEALGGTSSADEITTCVLQMPMPGGLRWLFPSQLNKAGVHRTS